MKTLGEWVKEATAWVDDKCLDWTGGCLQKHLAHACTCLQKYCTKLNISTAICKTSFIMRRGFDICNTFANLCPLCPCKIGLRGEREWTVLGAESQKTRQRVSNADQKVFANPDFFCDKSIIG